MKKRILTVSVALLSLILIFTCLNNVNVTKVDTSKISTNSDTKYTASESSKKELFSDYYDEAEKLMEKMTIEEKVSQMFYVAYPTSDKKRNEQIKKYNPGGYILFARDFKGMTKKKMKKRLSKSQKTAKINMFIGVDEEGGTVVRVSMHKAFRKSRFKSPQDLWKIGYLNKIIKDTKEKDKLLKSIGVNMNFAPVVDVPTKKSAFIYKRSYGRGAKKTATYTKKVVDQMNKDKVVSSLKHFPGYGNNKDTHIGIAKDKRSYKTFKNKDFKPFEAGIKAGAPFILVNHNIIKCMDSKKPASLSKKVNKILRKDLNFSRTYYNRFS